MKEIKREDILLGEYEKLYCRNVYEYLTRNNKPQVSIPIKMSTFFGNSEHPFPEK